MNCQAVQNKILALPDPRHVPDSLRDHLGGCAGCREWAKQVVQIEGLLAQLPVPAAPVGKKARLIEELMHPEPIITHSARLDSGSRFLPFIRRNVSIVGGLAAAVLLAVGGWWLLTRPGTPEVAAQPTPRDPFVEKLVQRDIALARADTPAKRLLALGGLAEDLSTQTRSLARVASPADLDELAGLFDKVVKTGLARQVESMPEHAMTLTEKQEVYASLAKKLGDMAADADRLSAEVPPEAKPALQKIAASARDGQKKFQ